MLREIWEKFIKLSTIVQFAASKVSILISGTTLATALSIKFPWLSWIWAMIFVAGAGFIAVAIIYFSGWIWKEAKYGQHLSDVHPKMDIILKRLDEIDKKIGEKNEWHGLRKAE